MDNPWEKVKTQIGKEVKINNITIRPFLKLTESKLSGMLHYKEISYQENIDDLKKFKKNDIISVKILEIKDDKQIFKRALEKDPLTGSVIIRKSCDVIN